VKRDSYDISTTISGEELNHFTCDDYKRQGRYCSQCIDGYGPAVFSDDATCVDCSNHRYLWLLNLIFQLFMVTLLGLLVILKGTSSPFNVIIMYAQLATVGLKLGGNLNTRLVCFIGQTFTTVVVTTLGVFNLDFFHKVIPPLCISPSFKAINVLIFDYMIASYPLLLTLFIYVCIEICDRYHVTTFSSCQNLIKVCHHTWNPKRTHIYYH
jgi:hypothetical protein